MFSAVFPGSESIEWNIIIEQYKNTFNADVTSLCNTSGIT